MGLFGSGSASPFGSGGRPSSDKIPLRQFDVEKRYDIYCSMFGEYRVYENMKILGIRTFDRIGDFSMGIVGGYLEIESAGGAVMAISSSHIDCICEHRTEPIYRVVRSWNDK